ncbi:MAG: iron hydrogenase small subunit, partial [Ruminiclostridium sp.]|nr:iron hydrogenase small subunit [Ruminiclostridium sp.]
VDDLYADMERRISSAPCGNCPVELTSAFLKLCLAQSCGKCVPCRIGLDRLADLLDQLLAGQGSEADLDVILRSAHFLLTGQNPDPDAFREVRGQQGWREATFDINGTTVRLAVASGLGNARDLIKAIKSGRAQYDFVEIMACPGGCAGGGGQPICNDRDLSAERGARLYELDAANPVRFSHENTQVRKLYEEYLEEPLGHKSHHLLHTNQTKWTL